MSRLTHLLFSYKTTLILLTLLGVGAAVATFIENDYGTSTARVLVYNHIWYEAVMVLLTINLMGIIYQRKMWREKARFIFHISFVVMLLGAGLTRYVGYEGIIHIREGATENRMISLEPYLQVTIDDGDRRYYQEYQKELSALGNDFSYTIHFGKRVLSVDYLDYEYYKKNGRDSSWLQAVVTLDGERKEYKLLGKRGMKGFAVTHAFGDTKVTLEYGSKKLLLPFSLTLRDFQLDRYPGSMSPASYASEITVVDKEGSYDYRIYMNHTLKHGNYQFFQSSYDKDERGTILSVNNDPGALPTYIGYFLLTLGLLMNLFDRTSRFRKLTRYIKKSSAVVALFVGMVLTVPLEASSSFDAYLEHHKDGSKSVAKKFGRLITQSDGGRMKPLNTLNQEIVHKLSRKSSLFGLNADQIVLGMMSRPEIWRSVPMIKVRTPKLKKLLGIPTEKKYIAFSDLFKQNEYKIKKEVEQANALPPQKRGTFEKDILRLDERLNIAYMVYYGNIFKIFPIPNSAANRWVAPLDAINQNLGVETMIRGFVSHVVEGDHAQAEQFLDQIAAYQIRYGSSVIPEEDIIDAEIVFNQLAIFPKLTLAYILTGLILFIVAFAALFSKKWAARKIHLTFVTVLALLFVLHTLGMGMRWYISGHAPWSDTYESLVYIAWSAMFAGLIFFRSSLLALSATVVMAGIFMFTAHLAGIDPQITNLVPVLKSYWLTIHVSVITGSYGFLAIGAMLGFMAMGLFIARSPKRPQIDEQIKQITAINEASLIIGLSALIVGNFLGGVWANESWGRYWGWDPKETWAWVSIIVYTFVLHLRLISKLNTPYIFSVASTLAFGSILMTYFGVNFYLSGMHSYATGDPVPIPMWVYVLVGMLFIVVALSSRKRNMEKLKV
jgi:cytochrome c-type biogenesis protein CcsB